MDACSVDSIAANQIELCRNRLVAQDKQDARWICTACRYTAPAAERRTHYRRSHERYLTWQEAAGLEGSGTYTSTVDSRRVAGHCTGSCTSLDDFYHAVAGGRFKIRAHAPILRHCHRTRIGSAATPATPAGEKHACALARTEAYHCSNRK